jgi:hypothetical protein
MCHQEELSMHPTWVFRTVIASCSLALALSTGACAGDNSPDNDLDRSAAVTNEGDRADNTAQRGHEGAPVTVTGCLQQGTGMNNFILTGVNRPTQSVGTSGSTAASGDAVEREQMRAAHHAYRLEGEDDDFKELVGKQVRVVGTMAEGSELWRETASQKKGEDDHGNLDRSNRDRIDVEQGDLARVDVDTVEKIAEACGEEGRK